MARNNILVIRLSALGDVAMVIAILREAAMVHPDREYTLLSRPRMESLLVNMPANVHFLPWPQEQKQAAIDWSMFDTVVDLHSVWRSIGIDLKALAHGKRVRRLHKPRIGRWLITNGLRRKPLRPMLERYRELLDLKTRTEEQPNVGNRYGIGIAPFAAHWGKIYPLSRMERVVAELSKTGEPIYLFGAGNKEVAVLEQWESTYPNVTSLAGKQGMKEELAIMAGLRVMITMDSGNMHMASLVGTRVVSIWGATHPSMGFLGYGQQGEDCIQRDDLACRPCSVFGKKPCKYHDYRCMKIEPERIIEQIQPDTKK